MSQISIEVEIESESEAAQMQDPDIKKGVKKEHFGKKKKRHRGKRKASNIKIEEFESAQTTETEFSFGNPKVRIMRGVLHLYKENEPEKDDADALAILAVPTVISCIEVLNFCARFAKMIMRIKILSTAQPAVYITLIKFREPKFAQFFYEENCQKRMNPSNPNSVCNLVFVKTVTFLTSDDGGFSGHPNQVELPTCPICLERMDESLEGILTILCNHSFHSECLMKWPDILCPVCRYHQSPYTSESLNCADCDQKNDLWMCLICGNVGCGRYENQHAFKHFEETSHTFSMKIGSSEVWDYAGDNYVHRLISCTDGKTVECSNEFRDSLDDKIESLKLEYNHLLAFQLSNQRNFYEEKLLNLEKKHQKEICKLQEAHKKDIENIHAKNSKKIQILKNCDPKKLSEEKAFNDSLIFNQNQLRKTLEQQKLEYEKLKAESEKRIRELEEDVFDLTRHLEIGSEIKKLGEDSQNDLINGKIELSKRK